MLIIRLFLYTLSLLLTGGCASSQKVSDDSGGEPGDSGDSLAFPGDDPSLSLSYLGCSWASVWGSNADETTWFFLDFPLEAISPAASEADFDATGSVGDMATVLFIQGTSPTLEFELDSDNCTEPPHDSTLYDDIGTWWQGVSGNVHASGTYDSDGVNDCGAAMYFYQAELELSDVQFETMDAPAGSALLTDMVMPDLLLGSIPCDG